MKILIAVIVPFLLAVTTTAHSIREDSEIENAEGKNALDDFVMAIINNFKNVIVNGSECHGLPPLDPLNIPVIPLNVTSNLLKMRGNISEISSTGLRTLEVTHLSCNLLTLAMDLVMEMPSLYIGGDYDLQGMALVIFPIYGKGPFSLNIGDVKISGGGQLAARLNGTLYMKQLDFNVEVGNITANFEGLLGGGELSDVLNQIINDLGLSVYNAVWTIIHDTLMTVMLQFINIQLANITLADIIGGIISPPDGDGNCTTTPPTMYL